MNEVQIAGELAVAVSMAVAFIRYWRQLVALVVGVVVVLSVIGLMTVISWVDAVSRP